MQSNNRLTQSKVSSEDQTTGSEDTKKMSNFESVAPPQTQDEAIEWLKKATTYLGLDATKYNQFEMICQLKANYFVDCIEDAEYVVRKAQNSLDRFKNMNASQ